MALAACSDRGPGAAPTPTPTGPASPATASPDPTPSPSPPSPSPSPSPTARELEPHPPYDPADDDVELAAKRLAGRIAQRLTTYTPDDTPAQLAARVADDGQLRDLVAAIDPLHVDGVASRGRVIYAQLGGLTSKAAAVLVVTEQETARPDGTLSTVTRTLDVRLERGDPQEDWRFDSLQSAGGRAVARPDDLSGPAAAVVDDPRIELPDSARWDIFRGRIDEELLKVMLGLADHTPYGVVVLASGHPVHVFDSDRVSNHTAGRAVDVYRIDDTLVVEGRGEDTVVHDAARWLFDEGLPELGSPWSFDDYGGRSFTDPVHQDHLHLGIERNGE